MSEETENDNRLQEELNDIFHTLKEKLLPVATVQEADITLTTTEFRNKIVDHFPVAEILTESDIYLLLRRHGYIYSAVGSDGDLQWLAKRG